ncbi:MAG: bifunctional nicotinamidase/pyrazinamidase [Fuerstiella sp.]|nr:bifunctional nicotinamidase/pyrazinamidase [Fuerstiella sp.]
MINSALILVDIQNDFLPGGALEVPGGDEVLPVANLLIARFDLVVATQDWHPQHHGSFASQHPGHEVGESVELAGQQQILWPDHCIQETFGAEFAPGLNTERIRHIFPKGTDPLIDSYSGFFDNGHRRATGLAGFLEGKEIRQVVIAGLATDYCVKFTAMDAVALGFETVLVEDGCRGVNLSPDDTSQALQSMTEAGISLSDSRKLT